ncbi:FAD-containing oxidoreductase [Novosphingobium sp. FGD1]|uniref:FAD-containing oxidoreductase n=1 Tax=Novosphingobium silvae TaxID=2692619 RepID=A0A7X4GIN6_9SPHN|nr:FAD-containing oxidoreductase [Novosphingobium silvae]MYL98477.1 FAD-containing oxidoreductase [Novosphingobium silvae]
MSETFDAIIIGAGQAGPALAGRLTGAGQRVALVERDRIGGTCVNTGCTPTKAMVASAHAAHLARRAAGYGVSTGAVAVDLASVVRRAQTISANARERNEKWLGAMEGLTIVRGSARFTAPGTIAVGERTLTAPRIFLNVGGRPSRPSMPGLEQVETLDNASLLTLRELPEHLVVVGGSYIGLEFAQMFRRFGAQVTVVEMGPRLLAREDEDISAEIRTILEGEGIAVRTGAKCISFAPHTGGVAVGVECSEGEPQVIGSHVLLAVGRTPNTDDLGLENAGIKVDERGYVEVDDRLQTSAPGVWALGDCNGRGAFTHTAWNDFEIVAANLLDGEDRRVSLRVPGYALYIDPPLGRVGMTFAQARASGKPLLVATRPMSRVARAIEKGETQGLMKIVADAATRRIMGAAILGTGGDEAIHGILDMMNADAPLDDLRWAVPIHPTVSELIPTVLLELKAEE